MTRVDRATSLLLALFLSSTLTAQVDPPRQDYVFHVYVDPIHGDNALASALNPQSSTQVPLTRHADSLNSIGGLIQQAPYAFRTITRINGALAYVNSVFSSLPWTAPHRQAGQVGRGPLPAGHLFAQAGSNRPPRGRPAIGPAHQ